MEGNYLNLDTHIDANVRALQTGEATMEDRIVVSTAGWKRMKRTRPDGVPVWDDVRTDGIDITDEVHAEYERRATR